MAKVGDTWECYFNQECLFYSLHTYIFFSFATTIGPAVWYSAVWSFVENNSSHLGVLKLSRGWCVDKKKTLKWEGTIFQGEWIISISGFIKQCAILNPYSKLRDKVTNDLKGSTKKVLGFFFMIKFVQPLFLCCNDILTCGTWGINVKKITVQLKKHMSPLEPVKQLWAIIF